MLKKYLCLITICLTAAAMAFAQGTFKPRDADEEQAWQMYNLYKESRRIETSLAPEVKRQWEDAYGNAAGSWAIAGVDWDAHAGAKEKAERMAAERKRQLELLAAWEKKFYWRYGDLKWADEKIYDAKAHREIDRIEFALTYFPFNYKPAASRASIAGLWDTSISGSVHVQLEFSSASSGRFFGRKGWETVAELKFDPATGELSFRRPLRALFDEPDQFYKAKITGDTMSGNWAYRPDIGDSNSWTGTRARVP